MNSNQIINRIQEATGYKRKEIAKKLFDIAPNNLSNKIKNDQLDLYEVVRWAVHNNVNIEWLLTGKEPNSHHQEPTEPIRNLLDKARVVLESASQWSEALKPNIEAFYVGLMTNEYDQRGSDNPDKIPEGDDRRKKMG